MTPYQEIPKQYLQLLQILHLGIGFAVLPLTILIPAVAGATEPSEGEFNTIKLLTQFHVFIFLASFFAGGFVTPRLTNASKQRLQSAAGEERDAAWTAWLESFKTAHVISLTLREGPALFGLVTLLLASINGVLWADSYFWLNYFSTALFVLYLFLSFPTAEKIMASSRF
jgi:hypothetical protein